MEGGGGGGAATAGAGAGAGVGADSGFSSFTETAGGGGDTSNASAITGTSAARGVGAVGGERAGGVSPPDVLCALAAARAAFSSWRFSARARAFCFLIALLVGLALDSDELTRR